MSRILDWLAKAHGVAVLERRMDVLARHLGGLMPHGARVLDVGCGNGVIAQRIQAGRPDIRIEGIDILARPTCAIPMRTYNGTIFPYEDASVDAVMFVDVLHHTPDPLVLLREAMRVTRHAVVIKDHLCESRRAWKTLAFMDWVGNRGHGVVLPYNYWSRAQWSVAWQTLGAAPDREIRKLGLYPAFARPCFETGLHFIARIPKSGLP